MTNEVCVHYHLTSKVRKDSTIVCSVAQRWEIQQPRIFVITIVRGVLVVSYVFIQHVKKGTLWTCLLLLIF